jgi:hypothetical protein
MIPDSNVDDCFYGVLRLINKHLCESYSFESNSYLYAKDFALASTDTDQRLVAQIEEILNRIQLLV